MTGENTTRREASAIAEAMVTMMEKELRVLWREVFGDSEEYLDLFERYGGDRPLAAWRDGRLAAALHQLPCELKLRGERLPAEYVYAAATRPDARKQGLMGGLLREALQGEAPVSVILPASPSLYDYYARFGYAPVFTSRVLRCAAPAPEEPVALTEDRERVYEAYCRMTARYPYLCVQDRESFFFALDSARQEGGTAAAFAAEGETRGFCVYRLWEGTLTAAECWCDEKYLSRALSTLSKETGADRLDLRLPPGLQLPEPLRAAAHAEPFGMLRVCDARAVLEAFARQNPGYDFHIRLQDELCPRNQGAFHVRDGRVGETAGPCQFELEIARLPSLLFERLEGEKPYFNLKIS